MAMTTHLITAEELLAMGNDAPFEIWEGELIEVSPSGGKSASIAFNVGGLLFDYAKGLGLGYFTNAEGGFVLSRNPHTVVAPDIGFISAQRLPEGPPDSFIEGRPDLAIEIISKTDEPGQIRRKQRIYDQYRVPMVWWIDPQECTVTVHELGKPPRVLDEAATLSGEDVLPGFSLSVERIFTV